MTQAALDPESGVSCWQVLARGEGILGSPRSWPLVPEGRVIIVASPSISDAHLRSLQDALAGSVKVIRFSTPLLSLDEIENLSHSLRGSSPPDFLVAIGGGSVLDAVKAARHFDRGLCDTRLVAVPSTVGSGAEATPFASYFVNGEKKSVEHFKLLPDEVVLDSALLASLPLSVVRASLLDALCQAVESLWSVRATARSRARALEGLALVRAMGPAGVGGDPNALASLQTAAYLIGQAIAESRTTLPHALSYELTARWGVPHGCAVALHLPFAAALVEEAVEQGGLPAETCDAIESVKHVFGVGEGTLSGALAAFIRSVGGQASLAEWGVLKAADVEGIVVRAVSNPRASNFPVPLETQILVERVLAELSPTRSLG